MRWPLARPPRSSPSEPPAAPAVGQPPTGTVPTDAHAQELEWVRRVQQHDDREAFAHLLRRHQGALRALLRRLCHGDAGRADELAQEAFLNAWQALPSFRGQSRLRTWLFRIAYHQFLQDQRLGARQIQARSQSWEDPGDLAERPPGQPSAPPAAATDPTAALQWRLDLERALETLPPAEREAIACCDLGDLSHAEAAEVLGRPLGTVKTQVLRGRTRLRLALAAWAPEPTL